MQLTPYLFFDGRCEEAAKFYQDALGAELDTMLRYKDGPEPAEPDMIPPGGEDKVMHMSLRVGDSVMLASDGRCRGQPTFQGVSLTLTVDDTAAAQRLFNRLSEGGQVQMPLTKTFFSENFGMVADRFGVSWMVVVDPEKGVS